MGYNDGRKQLERILKLANLLQKSRLRVRDLAERFGVHFTRIYDDIKILEKFFVVEKERARYWIKTERPRPLFRVQRWAILTFPCNFGYNAV